MRSPVTSWRSAILTSGVDEQAALDQYPWPGPLRFAAYVTWLAAGSGELISIGTGRTATFWSALVLLALYGVALKLLSRAQCLTTREQRFGVFILQSACAAMLLHLAFADGAVILFYVLAAELQFLVPFGRALALTIGLWALVVLIIVIDTGWQNGHIAASIFTSPAGFAFVAAFTRSAVTELVQRRRSTRLLDELNEAHSRLQAYAAEVEGLSVARERNRMAREIHDTLGHYLTVINVQIEAAQKLEGRDPARAEVALATAKGLASQCLGEVRRSVAALRPSALEEFSLSEALVRLVEEQRQAGLTVHLETNGDGTLPASVEMDAYRAMQEALTNVRKHASAHNVWLTLTWEPAVFIASVRDDGCGAEEGLLVSKPESFGLAGMRERIEANAGELSVRSVPGAGVELTISIPRRAAALATAS